MNVVMIVVIYKINRIKNFIDVMLGMDLSNVEMIMCSLGIDEIIISMCRIFSICRVDILLSVIKEVQIMRKLKVF